MTLQNCFALHAGQVFPEEQIHEKYGDTILRETVQL